MKTRADFLHAFYDIAGRESAANLEGLFTTLLDMALPEEPALRELTDGKTCAECGDSVFILVRDETERIQVRHYNGHWQFSRITSNIERNDTRLFCAACNTYHTVPEDLE